MHLTTNHKLFQLSKIFTLFKKKKKYRTMHTSCIHNKSKKLSLQLLQGATSKIIILLKQKRKKKEEKTNEKKKLSRTMNAKCNVTRN